MTDGDEETAPATSLWYLVDRRGTHVAKALGRLEIRPGRVLNQRIPIEMQFLRGATSFDISHWADPSESVLVRLEQVRRGVRVSLIALDGSSRVRFQGFAPLPRAPTGIRRVLAFATWSGDRPDLFAIDRNVSTGAVSVAVFGGESAFRQLIFSRQQLPISLAGPDPTTLDVFRVSGVPALIFVLPAALTHSRLPEVHVLDGRYDLERFLVESDLSSKLAGADPVVLGSSGDGATIYALHPTARAAWRVDAVPLTAAPPQVSDECSASSTSSP